MNAFTAPGAQDAANRLHVSTNARSRLVGRASDLAHALHPLHKIKPVMDARYLVKGWLDRGALSVVYGESNVGKTFFAMDLAMHVAAGMDWYGHCVPEGQKWARPVIYIAGEGGTGLHNRIEAMRRERPDLMKRIESNGEFLLLTLGTDLCTSNDAEYLVQAIKGVMSDMPALIVVDTLARTMGNGDESTARDMGQFVRSLDLLRAETGAHVMVIHHSGKDASKGARGSGSLRAAADTEIELTRNAGVIMAEARKQRDMPCDSVFAYQLKSVFLGLDDDGDRVTSAAVTACEAVTRKSKVRLTGTDKIGMQALSDALAQHGEVKRGDMFPHSRQCVPLERWREFCNRHSLSSGEGDSSKRTAFHKLKNRLQDKEIVRIVDGYVWRVADDDDRSRRSQPVPENAGNAGHAAVPTVPALYKSGNEGTLTQPGNEASASSPAMSLHCASIRPDVTPPAALPDLDAFDPEMWR